MGLIFIHTEAQADLAAAADRLVSACHRASARSGWWGEEIIHEGGRHCSKALEANDRTEYGNALVGTKLMLVVSEVAEAMEGHRKDKADDHLPHRKSIEVELADAVIRIADLCGALGLDLGGAIVEKMAYNAQRHDHSAAARSAAGGKAY